LPHPDLLRLHTALARLVRCPAQAGGRQGGGSRGEEEYPIKPVFYDWTHGFPVGSAFLAGLTGEVQDKFMLDGIEA